MDAFADLESESVARQGVKILGSVHHTWSVAYSDNTASRQLSPKSLLPLPVRRPQWRQERVHSGYNKQCYLSTLSVCRPAAYARQ